MKKTQNGFVLVSVLLITTISTIYAFSEINGNRLQERIGGNQQKEMNARLMAEKGVFDSFNHIKTSLPVPMTVAQIVNTLSGAVNAVGSIKVVVDASSSKSIEFTSTGTVNDAKAFLKAKIKLTNLTGSSAIPTAIIACESASLTGGGMINSYDSKNGPYTDGSASDKGDVTTINGDIIISGGTDLSGGIIANGNVSQSGSTEIKGGIDASGNVSLAQAAVFGDIHSGGTVNLADTTVGSTTIDGVVENGNVTSEVDLNVNGETLNVQGNVNVGGNMEMTGGDIGSATATDKQGDINIAGSLNLVDDSANSHGTVNVAGGVTFGPTEGALPEWYDLTDFSSNPILSSGPAETISGPVIASQSCDPLNVAANMPNTTGLTISNAFAPGSGGSTLQVLNFNETSAQTHDDGASIPVQAIDSSLVGGSGKGYVFESLNLSNTMIEISGDVTIVIKGALTTTGEGSGFKFADGDTTSSLTILTEGTVDIGSTGKLFEGSGVNAQGEVPLNLISSNATADAVKLAGAANSYAKIYAPLGDVLSTASGKLMGAVRGRNVTVEGAGGIHFDEQIKSDVDIIDLGSGAPLYEYVYYYYE